MGLSYFVDSMYFLLVDRPKLIESFLGFQCYLKFICFSFQFCVFLWNGCVWLNYMFHNYDYHLCLWVDFCCCLMWYYDHSLLLKERTLFLNLRNCKNFDRKILLFVEFSGNYLPILTVFPLLIYQTLYG